MPRRGNQQKLGEIAEQFAAHYLQNNGLELIERNYHCRQGEIDLIMRDNSHLVFVEVRYRSNPHFGGALESVDYHKQQRLLTAAQHYLQRHPKAGKLACRFDVIALTKGDKREKIQWIQNAFQA